MIEPIEFSINVPLTPERAFEVFTGQMTSWWPLETHSIYEGRADRVVFETFAGGEIAEYSKDGEKYVWGEILESDPPRRIVFTWHPGTDISSEVEITFEPVAGGTHVHLEHRGWEAFGELAEEMRSGYANGWPLVFVERYANAAKAAA